MERHHECIKVGDWMLNKNKMTREGLITANDCYLRYRNSTDHHLRNHTFEGFNSAHCSTSEWWDLVQFKCWYDASDTTRSNVKGATYSICFYVWHNIVTILCQRSRIPPGPGTSICYTIDPQRAPDKLAKTTSCQRCILDAQCLMARIRLISITIVKN